MDPNATLDQLRLLVEEELNTDGVWTQDTANDRLAQVSDLIDALDTWLKSGGCLPNAWKR